MAQLDDIDSVEARIARALARVMQGNLSDVMDALGNPPDFNNIDPEVWDQINDELGAVMLPEMEQVYLAAAEQAANAQPIGIDWTLANEQAAQWASQHTGQLISGIDNTTRRAVQRKVEAFFRESQTLEDLQKSLQSVFGPVRAEMIAVTESTRAAAEGEIETVNQLRTQGADVTVIWETSADERVCPICGPRQGKEQGDGWNEPPPAHVRCRCWLNFKFAGSSEEF